MMPSAYSLLLTGDFFEVPDNVPRILDDPAVERKDGSPHKRPHLCTLRGKMGPPRHGLINGTQMAGGRPEDDDDRAVGNRVAPCNVAREMDYPMCRAMSTPRPFPQVARTSAVITAGWHVLSMAGDYRPGRPGLRRVGGEL